MQPKNQDELNAAEALTGMHSDMLAPLLGKPMTREPATRHTNIQKNSGLNGASSITSKESLSKPNFPTKLFNILESNQNSDIICWLPGGKAFIIKDKKRFASEILPRHFKQSQFTSFTRKLTRWKFLRVPRGPYIGAYYHSLFRKDARALCSLMVCNSDKFNPALLAKAKELLNESRTAQSATVTESLSYSEVSQRSDYLKRMEDLRRAALMKQQLMRIQIRRAQLFEEQKRFLLNSRYGISNFPSNYHTVNHVAPSTSFVDSKNNDEKMRDHLTTLNARTLSQFLLQTSYHPVPMAQYAIRTPALNTAHNNREEVNTAEEWFKKTSYSAHSA